MAYTFAFFDVGINRIGTDTEKWDWACDIYGPVLPFWVADMDFKCPPGVTAALSNRAAHPSYGYTRVTDDDADALIGFWARRHGVTFGRDHIIMLPTVVTGLALCVKAMTHPGDGVVIQPPVYGPFYSVIKANNRTLLENPLIRDENGRWRMDLDGLASLFQKGARLMFLCSPHNPVSRVWTADELNALADLCRLYGVALISDEIHADFVYAGHPFHSMLGMSGMRTAALFSASKTFNIAGLQQASLVSYDRELLDAVRHLKEECGVSSGNLFALTATRAAYTEGDEWLDGLIAYLTEGARVLTDALFSQLPLCRTAKIEGTYLAFLDLTAYGFSTAELMERTIRAGALFSEGTFFSPMFHNGWLRFNFACPHRLITEGVCRLKAALEGI